MGIPVWSLIHSSDVRLVQIHNIPQWPRFRGDGDVTFLDLTLQLLSYQRRGTEAIDDFIEESPTSIIVPWKLSLLLLMMLGENKARSFLHIIVFRCVVMVCCQNRGCGQRVDKRSLPLASVVPSLPLFPCKQAIHHTGRLLEEQRFFRPRP